MDVYKYEALERAKERKLQTDKFIEECEKKKRKHIDTGRCCYIEECQGYMKWYDIRTGSLFYIQYANGDVEWRCNDVPYAIASITFGGNKTVYDMIGVLVYTKDYMGNEAWYDEDGLLIYYEDYRNKECKNEQEMINKNEKSHKVIIGTNDSSELLGNPGDVYIKTFDGLMSSTDKLRLDGFVDGANKLNGIKDKNKIVEDKYKILESKWFIKDTWTRVTKIKQKQDLLFERLNNLSTEIESKKVIDIKEEAEQTNNITISNNETRINCEYYNSKLSTIYFELIYNNLKYIVSGYYFDTLNKFGICICDDDKVISNQLIDYDVLFDSNNEQQKHIELVID